MTEIKLYRSKKKALKLFLLSAPFMLMGIRLITRMESTETERIIGWIITCFFGLGIPFSLFSFFDKRPQIIINETGIYDRTTHSEFINWQIIRGAYPISIYGQHFICLLVSENFKPSKKKNTFYKGVAKLNERVGAQELNIQLGQLEIDTIKLTEFINAMIQAEKSKKTALIKTLPYYKEKP